MAKSDKPDLATLAARALRKPGSISKSEIKALATAALAQATDVVKDLVAAITPAPTPAKPATKPKAAAKPKTATKPKVATKPKSAAKPKPS